MPQQAPQAIPNSFDAPGGAPEKISDSIESAGDFVSPQAVAAVVTQAATDYQDDTTQTVNDFDSSISGISSDTAARFTASLQQELGGLQAKVDALVQETLGRLTSAQNAPQVPATPPPAPVEPSSVQPASPKVAEPPVSQSDTQPVSTPSSPPKSQGLEFVEIDLVDTQEQKTESDANITLYENELLRQIQSLNVQELYSLIHDYVSFVDHFNHRDHMTRFLHTLAKQKTAPHVLARILIRSADIYYTEAHSDIPTTQESLSELKQLYGALLGSPAASHPQVKEVLDIVKSESGGYFLA